MRKRERLHKKRQKRAGFWCPSGGVERFATPLSPYSYRPCECRGCLQRRASSARTWAAAYADRHHTDDCVRVVGWIFKMLKTDAGRRLLDVPLESGASWIVDGDLKLDK